MTGPEMSTDWVDDHQTKPDTGSGGPQRMMRIGSRMVSKRRFYDALLVSMKAERKSIEDHWTAILAVTSPRRARFDGENGSRTTRNDGILNGKARYDARTLIAALYSRICSPADNWIGVGSDDPDFDRSDEAAQVWYASAERGTKKTMEEGEVYVALEQVIEDMVLVGTGAMFLDDDLETVIRAYHLPIGSYFLGSDARGLIDTCIRECSMTVAQLEERFGYDALSDEAKRRLDKGELNATRKVIHVVAPNKNYWPGRLNVGGQNYKKWSSCWYEADTGVLDDKLLGEKGYDDFPVIVGRWATTGTEVWATGCPGMDALPDAAELQEIAFDSAVVTKQMGTPPLGAPASMMGENISAVPGSITYLDNASLNQKIEPILRVDGAQLQAIMERDDVVSRRVSDAFYARLWVSLQESDADGSRKTATEIQEIRNEKRSLLAPLTTRFQPQVLARTVMVILNARRRAGKVQPYPKSMVGRSLKLTFRSEFSQAQKATQALGLDRLVAITGQLMEATGDTQVGLKIDKYAFLDIYADALGIPPEVTLDQKKLDVLLKQAAQVQQQAEDAAAEQQQAEVARNLAGADMSGDNALTRMTRGMQEAAA